LTAGTLGQEEPDGREIRPLVLVRRASMGLEPFADYARQWSGLTEMDVVACQRQAD
jgi:hypothetical protein